MEPIFERIFGGKEDMRLWFANLIMYSAALTVGFRPAKTQALKRTA